MVLLSASLLLTSAPSGSAGYNPADVFQFPLPAWSPHCLSFGSEWRYCNGAALRACPGGAVWLHTGVDISTGIQPVMAAGDGVIAGYLIDPVFRGGVLIRHGDLEPHAWNGALPPSACSGFPAFPYRFVDPTAFIEAHAPIRRHPPGRRIGQ